MNAFHITEKDTIQMPMVRYAAEVGWTPVSIQDALVLRGGQAGLFFRNELEGALHQFNPWLPNNAICGIVDRLEALPPTIEGNREMLTWLRGEHQWYDEAEQRHRPVMLIDFESQIANTLHVTWEWTLKLPGRKGNRADVMFLINGVPVAIVENKNPKDADAIERGVGQLLRYERETPELLGAAQLFNVTHLLEYWYGVTWNTSRRFMARWKETPEESYRFAVQSFFEPTDFLRTLQDWILFYDEEGETRKSVLRQHQRRAVDRIIKRCSETDKRRGLIWHTQGSGKTFTLLTAARIILKRKDKYRNPTVVIVVDRMELEGQLKGWVDRFLGEMQQQGIPVWQADSKTDLRDLLQTDKRGLILSMIHKFEGIEKDANTRNNIYVFIDEAHRSVAQDLGTYLMAALPNSTIIGFTGTPVARTAYGKDTFKIFGSDDSLGYLDKYTIVESIEDETTLPIRHTMAPSEITVPTEQLNREFFATAEMEDITDVQELNRVLDRSVGLHTFLTADDRIKKVAAFVAQHFRENVMPLGYKALLVGVNRDACARYKQELDKLLPSEWSTPVYTKNDKDHIDRPLVAKLQLSPQREEDARSNFKKAGEDPKILIVTDKLLTGYDAPLLYCLYLDKPMRDHVLLQAIARVNRPHTDLAGRRKRVGLVIDFVGVLRELRKALQFDSADVSGAVGGIDLLLIDFQKKISQAKANYLDSQDQSTDTEWLENVIYSRFLDPENRRIFFGAYKEIEALWEILAPAEELRDYTDTYKQLVQLYTTVRNAYTSSVTYSADLASKTRQMIRESSSHVSLGQITKTATFDVDTLKKLRNERGSNEVKVFNLVRGLRSDVDKKPEMTLIFRSLKYRAEIILKDLEERTITGLEAMDQLDTLAKEKKSMLAASKNSGLTPRGFSIYWTLKNDPNFHDANITSMDLAQESELLLERFPNAASNIDEERHLRAALYQSLLKLSPDTRHQTVEYVLGILIGIAEVD